MLGSVNLLSPEEMRKFSSFCKRKQCAGSPAGAGCGNSLLLAYNLYRNHQRLIISSDRSDLRHSCKTYRGKNNIYFHRIPCHLAFAVKQPEALHPSAQDGCAAQVNDDSSWLGTETFSQAVIFHSECLPMSMFKLHRKCSGSHSEVVFSQINFAEL